jgi:hypothetical protein
MSRWALDVLVKASLITTAYMIIDTIGKILKLSMGVNWQS